MTPLIAAPRLASRIGHGSGELFIKDEARLPTGSFKSRGMTAAVSMAKYSASQRLALPTAGNAGGALAAYGARAGLEVFVFMPERHARSLNQIALHGAKVFASTASSTIAGRSSARAPSMGWFDVSTLKEPYRLEGKKTMGLELAEQLGWRLPDVILYPTGGGTGLIGMWKAFAELESWLDRRSGRAWSRSSPARVRRFYARSIRERNSRNRGKAAEPASPACKCQRRSAIS